MRLPWVFWFNHKVHISQTRGSVKAEIVERWISKMWEVKE